MDPLFLTSALVGGEWSTSRPGRFTPGERAPGTHWRGGTIPKFLIRKSLYYVLFLIPVFIVQVTKVSIVYLI
jgi:hypothetical protein